MNTAGNSYSDATNTMTVGTVDRCLTTIPGNNAAHNHTAQLVIQDVEDLIGWQARLNYDGGKMRPQSVNFAPFADNTTGQNVGFLNLPIDQSLGVHRDATSASSIPAAQAGSQTALVGATYNGAQNAAISPDTPPKVPPDDTSYNASTGGVLAAVTLRVEARQSGQSSLLVDLDDGSPNPPGSSVVLFNGSGTTTIDLPVGSLGDGAHGEGTVCQ